MSMHSGQHSGQHTREVPLSDEHAFGLPTRRNDLKSIRGLRTERPARFASAHWHVLPRLVPIARGGPCASPLRGRCGRGDRGQVRQDTGDGRRVTGDG